MSSLPDDSFARFQPWRRTFEVGFWVGVFTLEALTNSITTWMDVRRNGHTLAAWEPVIWEFTSLTVALALIPLVVLFTRRYPLHLDTWRRYLPLYLGMSLLGSIVHVGGMVLLRKLAYVVAGSHYDFGDWATWFGYEYLKDFRTFGIIVLLIHAYRLFMLRWQGEVRVLMPAEEPRVAVAAEPTPRPERFLVRKLGREFLIAANDIEWIQAAGNYANLHLHQRDYPLRSTIADIETLLDPKRFARVHRSYIVNLDRLVMIEPLDSGDARLHLKDGASIPCSRRYRASLRERVGAGVSETASGVTIERTDATAA